MLQKKQRFLYLGMLSVVALLFAAGCGKKEGSTSGSGSLPAKLGHITFDSTVPSDQAQMLRDDLATLASVQFNSTTDAGYFGLNALTQETMSAWVGARISYIVGESYDTDTTAQSTSYNFKPSIVSSLNAAGSSGGLVTVMSNLGGSAYLSGKKNNLLYSLAINGTPVPVKSPRVGIIRIGKGLFTSNRVKSSDLNAMVNKLVRLGTLIHEARHSDGNGTNAAFPHAYCTISGQYSAACENNYNGPYSLEGMFLKVAHDICRTNNCTTKELEGIKLFQADSVGRLRDNKMPDARPEAVK